MVTIHVDTVDGYIRIYNFKLMPKWLPDKIKRLKNARSELYDEYVVTRLDVMYLVYCKDNRTVLRIDVIRVRDNYEFIWDDDNLRDELMFALGIRKLSEDVGNDILKIAYANALVLKHPITKRSLFAYNAGNPRRYRFKVFWYYGTVMLRDKFSCTRKECQSLPDMNETPVRPPLDMICLELPLEHWDLPPLGDVDRMYE